MKIQTLRRPSGFTLVELLVVIAIIAVLAAAGFAAGNSAIQKAKKVTCLATAVAIESAVNDFFTEYGSLPTEATTDFDSKVDTSIDSTFITAMLGLSEIKDPPLNTKSIKFLSVREGKKKGSSKGTNGVIYSSDGKSVSGLFDPWGGGYQVMMDADFSERLEQLQPKASPSPVDLNGRRVVVWSNGADGVNATGKSIDDVKTW